MNQELVRKIETGFEEIIGIRKAKIYHNSSDDKNPYLEISLASPNYEKIAVHVFEKFKKMIKREFPGIQLDYTRKDATNQETQLTREISVNMKQSRGLPEKDKFLQKLDENLAYMVKHYLRKKKHH